MRTYKFEVLDPRSIPAATAANDKIFQDAGVGVLGIEVTVPALAERCTLGNIDPQHSGGDASRAAIQDALTAALPPEDAILVTVRADLDSVGAMAILALRAKGQLPFAMGGIMWTSDPMEADAAMCHDRIVDVAEADRFARGGWPGLRTLPTRENPWPPEANTAESSRSLAAIAAAVADFRVPMANRVSTMEQWLLTGEEPEQYRNSVEAERLDMVTALEDGTIKVSEVAENRIAVVQSTHRAGTMLGYMHAPVVVALNPEFRVGGGEPHQKFTVCQFEAGYCDLRAAVAELNELEPGWGGSPTIVGSPQGVGSTLSVEEVVKVVERYLLPSYRAPLAEKACGCPDKCLHGLPLCSCCEFNGHVSMCSEFKGAY